MFADTGPYHGRLLCTEEKEAASAAQVEAAEPYFFCQINMKGDLEVFADKCREYHPKFLDTWRFDMPGRRILNSSNDVLLGMRTWTRHATPGELEEAMSGLMHPSAEAHAYLADRAYESLRAHLNAPP